MKTLSAYPHLRLLFREHQRENPELWSAESSNGMIATPHYLATSAGAEMLAVGGNAIDAAVAAGLTLSVCEPAESGLGGMAMMLIYHAETNEMVVLEGACLAPSSATPENMRTHDRYRGYRAVAIPTQPAVLEHAHRRFGKLSRQTLFTPAIHLAEDGYPVSRLQHRMTARLRKKLRSGTAAEFFLDASGHPYQTGSWFRQPVLANTLRHLAQAGFEDFYRGEIARQIVTDMQRHGGYICADDLAVVQQPTEAKPLQGRYNNMEIFSLGPPGGGISLLEMLQLFSETTTPDFDPDTLEGVITLSSIIQQARRDRERFILKFGPDYPGRGLQLLEPEYIQATASQLVMPQRPSGGTSHLSVMDRFGNAVALTQSIDRDFGAAVASPELGFLYNDYMNTFNLGNPKHPHYLRPGAKARSNATPSLLFRNNEPVMAIGAAGSGRITSAMFQVLVRLQSQQTPFAAVAAPRLHSTPQGHVLLEADRFPEGCVNALTQKGFKLKRKAPYSHTMGCVQLVIRTNDIFLGVADPRRDGAAAGPTRADNHSR